MDDSRELKLSVIIPSHNDVYLHKTIDSLLNNCRGELEIIVVLDGYEPTTSIKSDLRVRIVRHPVNLGMREAINTGVASSRARHIMRTDEHCMFGPGFDVVLLDTIEDNWIVTPRRYKLDPVNWVRMPGDPIDYEKLIIKTDRRKFSGVEWRSRARDRAHIPIDETMAMQGSCWAMSRRWWDNVIGRLDSAGYGTLYQDSTEMQFKTWRAGGKLMVNKLTWFAHKHRKFNRTHNYPGELADASFAYALDLWMEDYEKVKKKWGVT